MPDPQFVQLPFGPGLDKETGMMVVSPSTMQDLRNVYHHEGSLVVRDGVEKTNQFYDGQAGWSQGGQTVGTGDDATHILAGIAIRSERAGIVVSWHSTHKRVSIWRVNGLGEESTFVGFWPFRSNYNGNVASVGDFQWPFDEPPKVILAEMYGQVFFAHDSYYDSFRADTYYYNPWGLVEGTLRLGPLAADFLDDGLPQVIRFRGVVRHLHYLIGWGWGTAAETRPELLRISLPGEPTRFDKNHYFIVGDRRDPIVAAEPARQTLLVCKETATYQLVGYSRATFGMRPYDNLYGALAGRLITSVSGTVFVWSAEGPMMGGDVGPFEKIWLPLDLGGFEPATLVERADFEDGWADYIDEVELAIFCFGRRAYVLSLRNPADPRWTYWELGKKAFCGFRLWGGVDIGGVPTGEPTHNSIAYEVEGCGQYPRYIVTVNNSGQTPTDLVQIYHRPLGPFWGDNLLNDRLSTDSNGDGIPDSWEVNYVAPFATYYYSATELAYRIAIGNAAAETTDTNDYIELLWTTGAVTPGTRYRFEADVLTLQIDSSTYGNAPVQIQVQYYDSGNNPVGALQSRDCRCPIWQRVWMEGTAPGSAAYAKIGLRGDIKFVGDVINAAMRNPEWMEEDTTPGAWVAATTPVLVSPETTQELVPVTVAEPGMDYEVAVRYVNIGLQPTPGYEGDDASLWPASSRTTAQIPMDAPDWQGFYGTPPDLQPGEFRSTPQDGAGDYFIMNPGCDPNNGVGTYGLKYLNRDLEIQENGATIGYMHRGEFYWTRKLLPADLFTSYQYKMRYLGPDRNSPFGAAITLFAGEYEGTPTITELTGIRGGYQIFISRSGATWTDDNGDEQPIGVEIQDNYDAVTGGQLLPAGQWNTVWISQYSAEPKTGATRQIYPPTDEIIHGNRANGLQVSVRVRQYYEIFPLSEANPEETFIPSSAGPWSEVKTVTVG